jgi:hypothetical protein
MMTRTTLKALWFGGGGILATWLAVTPGQPLPGAAPSAATQPAAASREPNAEDLNALADRLRERTQQLELRPSTRNPFRYSVRKPASRFDTPRPPEAVQAAIMPAMPAAPPRPAFTLSGMAQTAGKRTAIISGDGQIYLVSEGDSVAGRFIVAQVDAEAVLLRDSDGAELRLALPQ